MNKTKIEWTEYSWNPITGCTPIREGCKNCYAQRPMPKISDAFFYETNGPERTNTRRFDDKGVAKWKNYVLILK